MQTKAELEAEISRLRERVAELEGAVTAYQFALAHKDPAIPSPHYPNTDWAWTFNPVTPPFQIIS
jgi:hypothetical protein